MRFPLTLNLSMAWYLFKQKLNGNEKFPLVLMLEPTHRCNLQCKGCGRIREYHDTIDKEMTLEECLEAIDTTGTPVVTITGGEPLLYSQVRELVNQTLKRKRHIFFCTNGILLEDALYDFEPHRRFFWNVHFDGTEAIHDEIIGRSGGFERALRGVKKAKSLGFRVTTNTTVYRETDISDLEKLFAILTRTGVDGILVAPGFSYTEVEEEIFLNKQEIMEKFKIIRTWSKKFPIISNPIYLDFCAGIRKVKCTPWGNPTRNPVGWKSPCYLITDTHYPTFKELMENTNWEYYSSGEDPRCKQCMVHCGYEPTIVRNLKGKDLIRMMLWNMEIL